MRLSRLEFPPIYALTSELSPHSLSEQVTHLVASGIRLIQVRRKSGDDLPLWQELRQIIGKLPRGVRLVVNDRVDLALSSGAHGVHLGEHDLPAAVARQLAGSNELIIGVSTHSVAQAVQAANDETVDYVAIGPIFRSSTKDVRAPLGISVVEELRSRTDKPIVAIGGITSDSLAAVLRAGADSAALIAALHEDDELERNVSRLMAAAECRQ